MILQFIHESSVGIGQDDATRSKVRSQAMRDFRRRQREAKERGKTESKNANRSATTTVYKRHVQRADGSRSGREKPPCNRAARMHTTALVHTPSAYGNYESGESFDSPNHIALMLQSCVEWTCWLRPGLDMEQASKVSSYAYNLSPRPVILAACMLASIGYADARNPCRQQSNWQEYKGRVLHDVLVRTKDSRTSTSPLTLSALLLLATFELMRGHEEAGVHLRGLSALIQNQGGISSLRHTGLPVVMETLDAIHSMLFNVALIFPVIRSCSNISRMTHDGFVSDDDSVVTKLRQLMKLVFDDIHDVHHSHQSEKSSPSRLFELLNQLCPESADFLSETERTSEAAAAMIIRAIAEITSEFSVHDEHLNAYVTQACHRAFSIWVNVITSSGRFDDRINDHSVQKLLGVIRSKGFEWEQWTPRLISWVFLTGMVASRDRCDMGFFQSAFVKTIGQSHDCDLRNFMHLFGQVKSGLESARNESPILPDSTDKSSSLANTVSSRNSGHVMLASPTESLSKASFKAMFMADEQYLRGLYDASSESEYRSVVTLYMAPSRETSADVEAPPCSAKKPSWMFIRLLDETFSIHGTRPLDSFIEYTIEAQSTAW